MLASLYMPPMAHRLFFRKVLNLAILIQQARHVRALITNTERILKLELFVLRLVMDQLWTWRMQNCTYKTLSWLQFLLSPRRALQLPARHKTCRRLRLLCPLLQLLRLRSRYMPMRSSSLKYRCVITQTMLPTHA